MSTLVAVSGILTLLVLMATLCLLWAKRHVLPREAVGVFGVLLVVLAISRVSDALAYLGITDRIESIEDHVLIVAPALWCFMLFALDREAAHREALRATQQVSALLEQAPVAVWTTDRELLVTNAGGHGFETLGMSPGDLTGRRITEALSRERSGVMRVRDDQSTPRRADSADWLAQAHRRALAGEIGSAEGIWSGRTLRMRIRPLLDDKGCVRGTIGVALDATEQKRLEVELQRAHTLEAVARLASGIAHDLNNMLTVIVGATGMLKTEREREGRDGEPLAAIGQASERAVALTRQLLTFARRERQEPRIIALPPRIDGMREMLRGLAGDHALTFEIDQQTPPVIIDPVQFEQVVANLVVNARDASRPGDPIVVRLRTLNSDSRAEDVGGAAVWGDPFDGPGAALSVEDRGTGIARESLPHLFEPFFTTKPHGKGTGLGLATVYGAITRAGGCIAVTTGHSDDAATNGTHSEGSRFTVMLPAASGPAEPEPRAATPRLRTGVCVLLVEDEPLVRDVTARSLRAAGCVVEEAASIGEALAALEKWADHIELIVTDLMLPDGSGLDVIARARRSARVPALVMTGLAAEGARRAQGIPDCRVLAKPFLPEELVDAAAALLATAPPRRSK